MEGLTYDEQTAALEGWSMNPRVPMHERLEVARDVIDRLHARERERVRAAVADALSYAFAYHSNDLNLIESATRVRSWAMEAGSPCPLCMDVDCGEGCPLARLRDGLAG